MLLAAPRLYFAWWRMMLQVPSESCQDSYVVDEKGNGMHCLLPCNTLGGRAPPGSYSDSHLQMPCKSSGVQVVLEIASKGS